MKKSKKKIKSNSDQYTYTEFKAKFFPNLKSNNDIPVTKESFLELLEKVNRPVQKVNIKK